MMSSTPIVRNKTAKRARVGSNTCPKCDIIITTDSQCLTCCVCELNFCNGCTNISPILAKALKEDTTQNFKWTCNVCKQNFPSMTGLSSQLRSIEEKTDYRLNILEQKVTDLDTGLNKRVYEQISNVKPSLIEEIKTEIKASLQDEVRKEIREIEDQKTRVMNLIIFNLPESSHQSGPSRKIHDIKKIKELCTQIDVEEIDIKDAFRIGNPDPKKTRPLKIILNNKQHRKNILDNVHKIKYLPEQLGLKKCICVKDLTIRQRETNKMRRESKPKRLSTKTTVRPNENHGYLDVTIHDRENNSIPELEKSEEMSQLLLKPVTQLQFLPNDYSSQAPLSSPFSDLEETIIGGTNMQEDMTIASPNNVNVD